MKATNWYSQYSKIDNSSELGNEEEDKISQVLLIYSALIFITLIHLILILLMVLFKIDNSYTYSLFMVNPFTLLLFDGVLIIIFSVGKARINNHNDDTRKFSLVISGIGLYYCIAVSLFQSSILIRAFSFLVGGLLIYYILILGFHKPTIKPFKEQKKNQPDMLAFYLKIGIIIWTVFWAIVASNSP